MLNGNYVKYYANTTIFFIKTSASLLYKTLKTIPMLKWTAIFLVIAIVAALFGFTGIAEGAASIAKVIFLFS
jgi:uncharacterized membrane protein YtjA (UPF0391 family)